MRSKSGLLLALIFILIVFASFLVLNGMPIGATRYEIPPIVQGIRQGLDLRGGLYVIYEAQIDPGDPDRDEKVLGAMRVMRNRLDAQNQQEATIARQGDNRDRILVEIPGVQDPKQLANILAQPAVLKFIGPDDEIILTGEDVKLAKPGFVSGNIPVVDFELHPEGTRKFADATARFLRQIIRIELDGNVISEPRVNSVIAGGRGHIEGMGSVEEARQLASLIESGALPVPLQQMEIRTIGATLGANALDRAILSGIIGIIVILLFMLLYYRLPGLVADLAMVVYLILVILTIRLAEVTLTLPGIAGIILSVGMAVDANVVIFERIKEEMKSGKTLRAAVDSGFSKAFRAILDANITTLIAALVLLFYGTGPVQGFAMTLMIGILVSMFTAISFTRFMIRLVMNLNVGNRKLYGV